ncbi:MAG: tRNA pseudouridine(13) synthase TruD [Candidatus Hodarchaeota archaeon]
MSDQEADTYIFMKDDENEVERFVGIETYATSKIRGIGGEIKKNFKDFIVKEIDINGKVLDIWEDYKTQAFSEELGDRYTRFNLIKVNRDTFEALRQISKALKINYDKIKYSGLKDKHSISVQKISIKGDYIANLKKLNLKDIFIRNIQPAKKSVKLGSHWGNNFTVIIRNVENNKNLKIRLLKLTNFLSKYGFPNYFGLQRFGSYRPNSHIVGRYILEGNFKKAFEEFVSTTYTTESNESKTVRREFRINRDYEKAYVNFPKNLKYERNMIHYLIENPKDYEGSINTLPIDLKKLLISSFQSYLFNKMLSLRVKKGFPLFKPIKGDVINILDDYNGNLTYVKYIYRGFYEKFLKKALNLNRAVIIMPIIGNTTDLELFPLVKSLFKEIITLERINKNILFNNLNTELDMKGSIRAITAKPTALKILEFTDDDLNPGKKKVKFDFSLQKGSYATMLIRELINPP